MKHSIDQVAKALARFEEATGHKDFKKFHREQAKAFKRRLDTEKNERTGKPLGAGNGAFDAIGLARLLHLARWPAGLQEQDCLCRCGLFQPVGKGRADCQGDRAKSLCRRWSRCITCWLPCQPEPILRNATGR